jgi:predicted permease
MRIGLVTGRDFTEQDDLKSQRVVILNETAARRFWPGQNPLGRKLTGRGQEATVIGVVKDGKYRALNEPPRPFMYLSYQQGVWDLNLGVAVRTIGNPLELATTLRREVRALDTGVEVWALISGEDFTQAAFLPQRMATVLLVILGAVAVALAVIGIYGVMAYDVNQRTHEIGVRMALGAKVTDVICLVLGKGLTLAALGTAAGLAGAIALTRLLASFLYGVSPFDFATFGGITLSLGLVSLLACYIPARRAASVDPMVALRYE